MPRLGSGEIQFQGCLLSPAIAICICSHKPSHVPDRDKILAYLIKHEINLDADFSLVLDADNNEDALLVFGNQKTFDVFQALVSALAKMRTTGKAGLSGCKLMSSFASRRCEWE
jgi:hypothetical protein